MQTLRLLRCCLPFLAALLLSPSVLAGDSLDQSSGSSIRILSVDPPLSRTLRPGEKLQIKAVVEYVLAVEAGHIKVFVQNDEGRSVAVSCQGQAITTGKKTAIVSADIEVNRTDEIQFIVALYHNDGRSTAVTASRTYHVEKPTSP